PDAWRGLPDVWTKVVKPSCRTCHMHQPDFMNFDNPGDAWLSVPGAQRVCTGDMPNAMAPMLRLWRSTDPFLPDLFTSDFAGFQCGGARNLPPSVAIILPSDGAHLNYGGVNGVHFSAQATDPEDAFQDLTITWIDDKGNQIGSGPSFDKIFPEPGMQKVRAIAH